MRSLWSKLMGNAVVRFCFSHMLILLLVTLSCYVGFQNAFQIVQNNIMEENSHFLSEGSNAVDDFLHSVYLKGLNLAQADSLKQLEGMDSRSDGYYVAVKNVIKDFSAQGQYDDTDYKENTFIYLYNLDRLIYDSAVYRKGVFFRMHRAFGMSEMDLQTLMEKDEIVPWLYVSSAQELFYVFPCFVGLQSTSPSGLIVSHIPESKITQGMSFRHRFSSSSLFMFERDRLLYCDDNLSCVSGVADGWKREEGIYHLEENLMLVYRSASNQISYVLVIPQQEALEQLRRLQWNIILLLVLIVAVGTGIALLISMRTGKPINHIADMLEEENEEWTGRDLDSIHTSIERMIEDKQNNRPALQKAFFHSLLKTDFLSTAEMEYTAKKAGVRLSGDQYYAAQIRFFPQMDMEELGGEMVDEVRKLQNVAAEFMSARFPDAVWMYKRNALMTLYLIEASKDENLTDELTDLVLKMRNEFRADCCWGIGTPCTDLMYFWKSADEANEAVVSGDQSEPVCFYTDIKTKDRTCYLPYSLEEHLIQSIRSGDKAAATQTMEMIRHENVEIRAINRKQFITLNRRITDILAQVIRELQESEECLINLSEKIPVTPEETDEYFSFARVIIQDICEKTASRKSKRRNEKIQVILGFLEENYADPNMGLSMISGQFKLSEGYLSSLFKEEIGTNFADYLEQLRINQACDLLKAGVLVSLIAEKTGYNSVQSFRRAFKRVKGVSPSEYREA